MIKQIQRVLKQIDIYGQSIQLSFHKKNSYNTVFGGCISFIVLISFLVGCWFFGKELFLKKNPQVIMQERSVDNPKRIDVKPDNLIIMMGIANNNAQYIYDPTIFSVNAVQLTQVLIQDPHTGKQTVQLVNNTKTIKQCSMSDVKIPDLVSYFQNLNYTAMYCFDTQKDQVFFEGDFNQKAFSQLNIYFQKCQNSTSSQIICKSQEEIDKTLLLTKLSIFMSDHVIDPLNFENPVSNRAISLYSVASSQFPQETDLFLTNYYIDTDGGVFYQQLQQQQTFIFASQITTPLFGDPTILMKLNIRLQKFQENYMKRTYLKLADVVAQIGGLFKILILLGALITNPISKLYYFKAIIDEIYQFHSTKQNVKLIPKKQQVSIQVSELDLNQQKSPLNKQKQDSTNLQKDKDQENYKKQVKMEAPQAILMQNTIQTQSFELNPSQNYHQLEKKKTQIYSNQNIITQLLMRVKYYFQNTHNIIKYRFINYFFHAYLPQCGWKTQDRNLLNKGIIKIQENFDILYIFNKLLEIDKMKSILFNSDQLNLFEYMPKPTINDESVLEEINLIQNSHVVCAANNPQDEICSKSQNNIQKQTNKKKQKLKQLRHKDETQMAKDAYEGLNNILNKKKLSKVDENLIRIIDPEFLQQIQQQKQSNLQDENETSIMSSIFRPHLIIQSPLNNLKKEIDYQYPSSGKNQSKFFQKNYQQDQQTSFFDQSPFQQQSENKNDYLEKSSNLGDSQYFVNLNEANVQAIKNNDTKKFIPSKCSNNQASQSPQIIQFTQKVYLRRVLVNEDLEDNMKRYSSVQPSRTNNYQQSQNQEQQSNQSYNIDDMEVVITKIKRQEIKIKEPWCKVPSQKLNCGKSHNDQPEYTHVSAQKWLENRIKKRNQERALLKALQLQKEQEEQFKDCIYQAQFNDDINNKQGNQQNKNLINSSSSQLRQEKVLWKKRMIYELHDINRFMDEYNQEKRQERAFQKRQKFIGDLDFDDRDQKKLEHHKEQRDRLNQLHKRLYGHESLERVLAKGLIKELLQDFINHQINIGIKEKDEITETLTINSKQINAIKQRHNSIEQKLQKDSKPVSVNRKIEQNELPQKKAKSKSYHSTYIAKNSPDTKTHQNKQEKTDEVGNKNRLEKYGDEKEQENKNNFKTRSDVHFHNIDKINKQINYRMIKNDNQQYIYTFAESQAIRDQQSDQIIQQNKQRQSLIEEQVSSQYFKKNEQEEAVSKQKYNSCNTRSFRASDHVSGSQLNGSQDDIFMSILNKSLVYLDKDEKNIKNLKQNLQSLKKGQSIIIQESDIQENEIAPRESLNILGDQELGKDYFKYLRKNNEQQQQKQEEEIKLKLKDNPSFTKILAMKKIENISKLQNFYDDYINHIQKKILNNNEKVQKLYVQKPEYKSLSVLPNMQRKAEMEEEEKLRKLREEEEKKRAKKTRVFKKFQSQNDLSEVTTTMNAKTIKIKEQEDKQAQTFKQAYQKNNEQNGEEGFSQIYDKILSMNLKKKQILQENGNYHENTIKFQILNTAINGNTQRGLTPIKNLQQAGISTSTRQQHDQQQQKQEQQNTEQNNISLRQKRDNSPLTQNLKFINQNNNDLNCLKEQQKFVLQLQNKQDDKKFNNFIQNDIQTKTNRLLQNNSHLIKQNTSDLQNSNQKIDKMEGLTNEIVKNNKFKINIQQQECYKPTNQQEMNSPLVKRVKEEKISNNINKIDQNQYYTPQKVMKDLENPQKDQISMSNRNTTAESPDIKLKYKQTQSIHSAQGQRKSDSVGRFRSFQNLRNVSISNLQGFEKVNQQSSISFKTNGFSNASLIEKVINLNKQCISESQNVNKINKHILMRQKRNLRTFTKLDNMVNNII
ncbi:transmembrane protein, putative (macronuclear) [Tetrahymena thermophila SB210]|uniref:Transmembrane protein, putative n=1 Tax=Tetrahymena thermophila (strain SB210) TaxID=312017 RepID=Q22M07_TETTS|nr:transmembrane protein, putative [Tetrahymena thermophila SB210]EAR86309.2 transmembrane protein, putative [Tetrahymena thermophila SB210]|eukprot:XP_977213.2 transmembrane protein, putative [Tetrahymena thermophila SB210]